MQLVYWNSALFGSHGKQEAPHDFAIKDGDVYDSEDEKVVGNVCDREIPGVLMLKMGKTYGKVLSSRRLLYGFIPANRNLPMFLVPYSDGNKQFAKARTDRYAVIRFTKCGDNRPEGILTNTLGCVGDDDAYDEYILYHHKLNHSLAPFKKVIRGFVEEDVIKKDSLLDVFAIDPPGCRDYDDAFNVEDYPGGGYRIRVCIADACYHLDRVGGWDYLGSRLQTVYLVSGPRNMLPPLLSDNLVSLVEGKTRHCVVFEFIITPINGHCQFVGVTRKLCFVKKNYVYDTPELLTSHDYKSLSNATNMVCGTYLDSHDVVAWWMVKLNAECGRILASEKTGIFRECTTIVDKRETILTKLGLARIAEWESCYTLWHSDVKHEALECGPYAQSSSPIRRLCDVVNQCLLLALSGYYSHEGEMFCHRMMHVTDVARMTEYSRSASRAERESRVAKYLKDAATDTIILGAFCVEVRARDHKGIVRFRLYIDEIGHTVTHSSTRHHSVGDNVRLQVTRSCGVVSTVLVDDQSNIIQ